MIFAQTALLIWPFLSLAFFAFLPIPAALVMSIIGGYLFLPELVGFNLPLLPPLDKSTIPALSALVGTIWAASSAGKVGLPGLFPRRTMPILLTCMMLIGAVGTVLVNGDAFEFRGIPVRGLPLSRILPNSAAILFTLLPFFLARKYLETPEAQAVALKTMVFLGTIYALLVLFEVRMSPQLNLWVYGFFPHDWMQHLRGDGFRPVVFLNHGLWVSIFLAMAFLAAFGLAMAGRKEEKFLYFMIASGIYVSLYLTKSLGAFVIANVLLVLFFVPRRMAMIALGTFVTIVLVYPLMRGAGLVPTDALLGLAESISSVRASSLGFRFSHEFALLEHANDRFLFGWGEYGRNQSAWVDDYNSFAVPDGRWVITMSASGYVGYLSEFGLLSVGILALVFGRRAMREMHTATFTIAIMTTANLIDLIPNGTLTVVSWFWAGALCGLMEEKGSSRTVVKVNEEATDDRRAGYARSGFGDHPYRRDLTKRQGHR